MTMDNHPNDETGDNRQHRQRSSSNSDTSQGRRRSTSRVHSTPQDPHKYDNPTRQQSMMSLLHNQDVYRPILDPTYFDGTNPSLLFNQPINQQLINNMLTQNPYDGFIPSWTMAPTTSSPTGPLIHASPSFGSGDSLPIVHTTPARDTRTQPSSVDRTSSSRPPRPELPKLPIDRPSGNKLKHKPRLPKHPPIVNDSDHMDIVVLDASEGRAITNTSDVIPKYSNRMEIAPEVFRKDFNRKEPGKDISALLRLHYKGDFYWDQVSCATRDFLWEQFGLRYRWDNAVAGEIFEVWEALNRKKFGRMLEKAKRSWKFKNTRAKWLFPSYYRRLVKLHWMTPEQKTISERHAKNRGHKSSYYGGSVGVMHYQRELEKVMEVGNEDNPKKPADIISPTVFIATKSKNFKRVWENIKDDIKKKSRTSYSTQEIGSDLDHEPEQDIVLVEPQWGSPEWYQCMNRYWESVNEKFRDQPYLKPTKFDELDIECWSKSVRGPKKGRLLGLGAGIKINELGIGRSHCTQSLPQAQADNNELLQGILSSLLNDPDLDEATRTRLSQRIEGVAENFHYLKKGKVLMQSSSCCDESNESLDED